MPAPSKGKRKDIQTNHNNQVIAVLMFATSIFLFFLILVPGENVWSFVQSIILGLFGTSAVLWPVFLMYVSITTAQDKPLHSVASKIWLSTSAIVFFCSTIYTFRVSGVCEGQNYFGQLSDLYVQGTRHEGGGLVGGIIGILLVKLFGVLGARIFILISLFVVLMFLTGTTLLQLFTTMKKPVKDIKKVHDNYKEKNVIQKRKNDFGSIDISLGNESMPVHPVCSPVQHEKGTREKQKKLNAKSPKESETKNETDNSVLEATKIFNQKKTNKLSEPEIEIIPTPTETDGYKYPPVNLLEKSSKVDEQDVTKELQTSGQMLVDTLKSFGVQTKIIDICRGPAVTRYELQPATGVKISKITNLADDIALNLAASGVRIEAPIPGKAAVGIEIPNKLVSVVKMRELISSSEFVSAKSKLSVVVGRDIAGEVKVADLAKMPHLLIAGSTGSGKSVCINSFIISLLYKSSPADVRLLMIDPKVVELGVYNGIPHLLVPVVTDPKKAAGALNWAVSEMLNRYKLFAEKNVRDLQSYNRMVSSKLKSEKNLGLEEELEPMPQIVIIIDELADLMMVAPNEVEDAICRLAQMARAAGMHIVIATQRPSVDVITGIIKANIPSRIALAVSSQIDSRTILDMGGAEKLLGRGDMLFAPIGAHKPIRVQGCYVTDAEIESVVDFIKNSGNSDYDEKVIEQIEKNAVIETSPSEKDETDPMLEEAIKCVVEAGQASTSLLQRRLRVGYARAGRLVDNMEKMGVVGPYEGSKPRQVTITHQQWLERNMMKKDRE